MELRTKHDALKLFGSYTAMADALGVNKSAISQWEDDLTQRRIDELMGAALRLGLIKKKDCAA